MTIDRTFKIPTEREEILIRKLRRLAKKATEFGTGKISWDIVGHDTVTFVNEDTGIKSFVPVSLFKVQGEPPAISGYTLVATASRAPAGNGVIIHRVPGFKESVSEHCNSDMHCDHCKSNRPRKDMFLLKRDSDGAFIQVGRNCLADFIGGTNPQMVAAYAEDIASLLMADDSYGLIDDWATHVSAWDLQHFLVICLDRIRDEGYISRVVASNEGNQSTADAALEQIMHPNIFRIGKSADFGKAADIIAWASAVEVNSDYDQNLRTIAQGGMIDVRTAGYAASMPVAYQRFIDRQTPSSSSSEFQGSISDRLDITVRVLKVDIIHSGSCWGDPTLVKMIDGKGNLFSTFASSTPRVENGEDVQVGDQITCRGTVKAHREFRGVKETQLTRVKFLTRMGNPA